MKIIDKLFMDDLCAKAAESPRLRAHYNLHESLEDPIQRVVMACVMGTYIRPHRHLSTNKTELFTILRGRGALITFNDRGVILHRHEMAHGGKIVSIELSPDEWHTFIPLSDDVVIAEVKPGPYVPTPEEDFASWSPKEGEELANDYIRWFRVADEGETRHIPHM